MNKVRIFFAALFTVCAVSVASAQTVAEVSAKFNEAAAKLNAKDYAAAIPLFEETIKLAESSSEDVVETQQNAQKYLISASMNQGMKLGGAGKFDEAIVYFQKAYDMADQTGSMTKSKAEAMISNVYIAKGTAFAKEEKMAEAAAEFNKAYEFNKKNTKAALLAAQHYSKAGDTEKSDAIYKEIMELGKTHSKYEDAAKQASDAYAQSYLVAASEAIAAKDYAKATENLDKIAAVDPENAQALMLRVQAANNFKKVDDVIKYGDAAVAAQTDDAAKSNVNFLIGAAYQTKENKAKAIEYYKKVTAGDNVSVATEMVTALSK